MQNLIKFPRCENRQDNLIFHLIKLNEFLEVWNQFLAIYIFKLFEQIIFEGFFSNYKKYSSICRKRKVNSLNGLSGRAYTD